MSKPTVVQVIKSVFAAFIGVQSNANRQQDFSQGSLVPYIIAGLVFVLVFIGGIMLVVSLVLA
jgi:hypothetical protein